MENSKPPPKKKKHARKSQLEICKQKQATVTYIGKETPHITKIFEHTNTNIAYRTNNTIQENFTPETHNNENLSHTGVYKLTKSDCGIAYIGQKELNFPKSFNVHLRAFRNNCNSSKLVQYLNIRM